MRIPAIAIFITLSVICFLVGMLYLRMHLAFADRKKTGKISGFLEKRKHRKNVPFLVRGPHGNRRIIIKNQTKGVYRYIVNGKSYKKRHTENVTFKQMPYTVGIVYLKKYPRICYVEEDLLGDSFDIYAILFIGIGVLSLITGISVIFI